MQDIDSIDRFDKLLQESNIPYDYFDIESVEEDDEGNRTIFWTYFVDLNMSKQFDFQKLKNLYNETDAAFRIDEIFVKRNELNVLFKLKTLVEEKILYL